MNANENIRLTKMEQSVEEIKSDISAIKSALIGNELSGDRGVIGQVSLLKAEMDYLKKDIDVLKEDRAKNSVIIKIISAVSLALLGVVLKLLFG